MSLYRYSRWDWSQDVPVLSEDAIMEQLADELLATGDLTLAVRNLLRRGLHDQDAQAVGLQDLLEQIRQRRHESYSRYDLSTVMNDVRRDLQAAREHESRGLLHQYQRAEELRQELARGRDTGLDADTASNLLRDLERRSAVNQAALDGIPWEHPGKAIDQLRTYEFTDDEARGEFDTLLASLQRQAAETLLTDVSHDVEPLQPIPLDTLKQMLLDLDAMLRAKELDQRPDVDQFLRRHGSLFQSQPSPDLDDLIDQLQRRIARTGSLLQSLSGYQRQELQQLLNAAFKDQELQQLICQVAARMDALDPAGALSREYPFVGDHEVDITGALEVMNQMQDMDRVERQLRRAHRGGTIQEVDPKALEGVLGERARQDLEGLARITDILESSGYIQKSGPQFELTPKGMRKIGQRALQEIFALIKNDRAGVHVTRAAGQGVEFSDSTKAYEFGDAFLPQLQRTIMNAILRDWTQVPVHLRPEDFEVYQTEQSAQSSTVLMLDLSLSMAMRGNFMAAKKVALALDNLIRTCFPRDKLYIVGFSTYAREMQPERLAYLRWDEFEPYTNIQHGLELSRKLLGKIKGGTKQIIMISDGEPTAHIEGGQVFRQYPPSPRTIRQTLAEVRRCTQNQITINTFMLDRNTYLVDFVAQMARLNRGRVFYTTPERLGKYLLADYLSGRRKKMTI